MRLPPALTVSVARLDPRGRRTFLWATLAGLALVLGLAARARFAWPQWPVADPDTWGYLFPALGKLEGKGFVHTYGRNFLYPGFVYEALRFGGTFRAVPVMQHLLGLATGALLWVSWRQWRAWFAETRLPAWADALLGLGLVAFFVRSGSVIHFEAQIRPEAVFPFFGALGMCLLLGFGWAWFVDRRPMRAALLAGAGVFDTALLYQLKPSFGLAVLFALAPLGWAAFHPWSSDRTGRWRLGVAVMAAASLAGAVFVLPERQLARTDAFTETFLPETLLTVHAAMIRDQMARDVQDHAATPFPPAFLAEAAGRMDRNTRFASERPQKPYESLGYNPDTLMYRPDGFCGWLNATLPAPQAAAFCYYYYRRAALHEPGRMTGKVLRQLGVFYNIHCPAFWDPRGFAVERLYRKTNDALGYPNYQQLLRAYPPGAAYLDASKKLQRSKVKLLQPRWTVPANVAAAVCYLPLLALFIVGMVLVSRWPAERRAGVWAAGWLVVMIGGLSFGNCLTIAVVHSLDVARYAYNLLVYAAWCELAAAVWLAEVLAEWIAPAVADRRRPVSPAALPLKN